MQLAVTFRLINLLPNSCFSYIAHTTLQLSRLKITHGRGITCQNIRIPRCQFIDSAQQHSAFLP